MVGSGKRATRRARAAAGAGDAFEQLAAYYRSPAVRARILEYCGASSVDPDSMSALGVAGYGGTQSLREPDGNPVPWRLAAWSQLLEEGADVCRSLADRAGVLLLLELVYANHDDPVEPYRDPERTFARLEPVYAATLSAFARHGMHPLVLMSARGYQFVIKAPAGTPLHTSLVGLGVLGESLRARYAVMEDVPAALDMGSAHEGAGRLLEYVSHEVRRSLAGRTEVPVAIADLRPRQGGAFVRLDLGAYGDPLFVRYTRCAFSSDQEALVKAPRAPRPVALVLPRGARPLAALLAARTDAERARDVAESADARVPAAIAGTEWVETYRASPLARFHHAFDHGPEMDPRAWPQTYDAIDLRGVPACAALALRRPNPSLLEAGRLRTVALALWGQGWHPRSVAGLVRSRFSRPYGWGGYWQRYDAESRARFDLRLCCGALAAGADDLADFTCDAQRARGLCTVEGCAFDLGSLRKGPGLGW
jgi:hypothetical protein